MGSSVAIDMVDMPFFFFSSNGQCEFRLHAGLCLDRNENKLKSELADPDAPRRHDAHAFGLARLGGES